MIRPDKARTPSTTRSIYTPDVHGALKGWVKSIRETLSCQTQSTQKTNVSATFNPLDALSGGSLYRFSSLP